MDSPFLTAPVTQKNVSCDWAEMSWELPAVPAVLEGETPQAACRFLLAPSE